MFLVSSKCFWHSEYPCMPVVYISDCKTSMDVYRNNENTEGALLVNFVRSRNRKIFQQLWHAEKLNFGNQLKFCPIIFQ